MYTQTRRHRAASPHQCRRTCSIVVPVSEDAGRWQKYVKYVKYVYVKYVKQLAVLREPKHDLLYV